MGKGSDRLRDDLLSPFDFTPGRDWFPQVTLDGIGSFTLPVPLARNALVRRFDVTLQADRANAMLLGDASQVRLQVAAGGKSFIVADFGMLRTVSGIGLAFDPPTAMQICAVYPWRGADFDPLSVYFEDCDAADSDAAAVVSAEANAFEVRTERLKITVKTTADLATIANTVFVRLPDLPADLDLRIDNGAPVFSAPGTAQPGARGWSATATQVVPLADALTALAGDPTDDSAVTFNVVLTSRVPGSLDVSENAADTDVVFLTRIDVGPEGKKIFDFESEGVQELVLPLPDWVDEVESVCLTVTGTVPVERVLPPVGPAIATFTGDGGVAATEAELMLDVDHAGAALLPIDTGLTALTGVRFPLQAEAGGAEVRVVLYTDTGSGPGTAVDGGASGPVVLEEGDPTADIWTTFAFAKPVALLEDASFWAAIVVSRGRVAWSLGRADATIDAIPIRRGLPTGPWHRIPSPFADPDLVGARVRVIGTAPKDLPVAPLLMSVTGAAGVGRELGLTPTAKGVAAEWTPEGADETTHPTIAPIDSGSGASVMLRLTSRVAGSFTVSAVDVVATK